MLMLLIEPHLISLLMEVWQRFCVVCFFVGFFLFCFCFFFFISKHFVFSMERNSQNDRMVGVGSDPWGSSGPAPCRSRVTQSRLHRTLSRQVWISPEKETPQPPWAAWFSAPWPSKFRSSSSDSYGSSYASVCARCPLSCRWAPLKRVWPHPPDTHPADIYKHF